MRMLRHKQPRLRQPRLRQLRLRRHMLRRFRVIFKRILRGRRKRRGKRKRKRSHRTMPLHKDKPYLLIRALHNYRPVTSSLNKHRNHHHSHLTLLSSRTNQSLYRLSTLVISTLLISFKLLLLILGDLRSHPWLPLSSRSVRYKLSRPSRCQPEL